MKWREYIAISVCILVGVLFVTTSEHIHAASTDIIFSEIMYNPEGSDTDTEWIEIYNAGTEAVTIHDGSGANSWRVSDGSNHTLTLIEGSSTLQQGDFAILADDAETFRTLYPTYTGTLFDTVLSLNNTTDTLSLSADAGETFFTSVTYEDTWGADGDGSTLEKIKLTQTNTQSNWATTSVGGTPGYKTIVEQDSPEENGEEVTPTPVQSQATIISTTGNAQDVRIHELYPNPETSQQDEFIELWNSGTGTVDITNWKLADNSKVYIIPETTLVPHERKIFSRTQTGIALNNTSEEVTLYDTQGSRIHSVSYAETIKGYSYAYDTSHNIFTWTQQITPGAENIILVPNDPPIPHITYTPQPVAPKERVFITAEQTTDPDNDTLTFLWKIGNTFQAFGTTVAYAFPYIGKHTVDLIVSDGRNTVQASTTIEVWSAIDVVSHRSTQHVVLEQQIISPVDMQSVYITEIFPNPVGADDTEWIELYNPNPFAVSLDQWILDDAEGGSKPYVFESTNIDALAYLVIGKEENKLILNNTSDEVRLFDDTEKLVDSVLYDDTQEAYSYAKTDEDLWYWTEHITKGDANVFSILVETIPSISIGTEQPSTLYDTPLVDIDLPYIRELELGTEVRVQGTVAVEPGVLGKTFFYITGSQGVQVYFSKKDWPPLHMGDVIGVLGTIAESNNERRIKITSKEDIVPLYTSDPPEPEEYNTGDIAEATEGYLVQVAGSLIEKKGTSWYIDDGSGEARVVFQSTTNITKPNIQTGTWIQVVGMVSETQSGYRILPRYQTDIAVREGDEGIVLGEAVVANEIERFRIESNNNTEEILKYVVVLFVACIILLVWTQLQLRTQTKKASEDAFPKSH